METIISLIPNDEHVAATRQELETAGFDVDKIDVLFQPVDVWQRLGGHQKVKIVFKGAAMGAGFGLLVGAIYGIPSGVFNCTFMNCPPMTSVALWALVTLFWVAAGGFIGAIVGLDKLEGDLYSYVEGVRRGETLFVIETPQEKAQAAVHILQEEQGTVIHDIHEEPKAIG